MSVYCYVCHNGMSHNALRMMRTLFVDKHMSCIASVGLSIVHMF